jgi:uncharacterized membrane protein YraQ (UPF0718 family)
MATAMILGAIFRMIEAAAQAAPCLLCGVLIAGVFHQLLGMDGTRRLYGGNTWRSLPQAWALGMLLPVCSLGAIPILRELRRAGVSGGVILAFALSAPLFNPLSLLYGLTLSSPIVILSFAFGSLIVISILGIAWERLLPAGPAEQDLPPIAPGLKRWTAVLVTAARHCTNASMLYCGIGVLGMGVISALLPRGCLQASVNHSNPWAPLVMAAVGPLIYVTPTNVMMQLGSMFNHGNSVGAAFALLTVGAGVNAGLLAWSWKTFGFRATAAWFLTLEIVVLGLGYAAERPLYLEGQAEANHTHVFDSFTAPFYSNEQVPSIMVPMLRERISFDQYAALGMLSLLFISGVALRCFDRLNRIDFWLHRKPVVVRKSESVFNRPLPSSVLGGFILLLAVALSIMACFIIYPETHEVFEDMRIVKADAICAVLSHDKKQAERQLHIWDDLARKLEIGAYLRQWHLTKEQHDAARNLRLLIGKLDDAMEGKCNDDPKIIIASLGSAYDACRMEFCPSGYENPR